MNKRDYQGRDDSNQEQEEAYGLSINLIDKEIGGYEPDQLRKLQGNTCGVGIKPHSVNNQRRSIVHTDDGIAQQWSDDGRFA